MATPAVDRRELAVERGRHDSRVGRGSHLDLPRILVVLSQRHEQHRTAVLAQLVVLRVLDQADDLHHAAARSCTRDARAEADAPADRIGAAEELVGERLVDDRHARRRRAVRIRERPAAQHSHPHHLEVVGRNGIGKASQRDTGRRHEALDVDGVAPDASAEQARNRRARRLDTGNGDRALEQAAIESPPLFDVERTLSGRRRHIEKEDALRIEADVDLAEA